MNKRAPYALDLDAVFEAASEHDTILELNSYPDRLDLKDDHLKEAKRRGIRIAINTDAHSQAHLELVDYGVATAQRGWLESSDVVNTYEIDELLKILSKN